MKKISKGLLESQISEAIIKFEIEYMGRGPEETKTYIIKDMVFIRLKGVLTTAEKNLVRDMEGKLLIKKTRVLLLEKSRNVLETLVQNITGVKLITLHTDISTKTGERIIIFVMGENLEERFRF